MKRRREINMENEDVKNTRTYTSYTKNIGKYEKITTLSKETKTEQKTNTHTLKQTHHTNTHITETSETN
jgi:hypothetical protein